MGFFSSYFNNTSKGYMNFANDIEEKADPRTGLSSTSGYSYKRPTREELERIYREDSQTFSSINKTKQLILGTRRYIRSKSLTAKKQYEDFFDNIGNIGIPMTEQDLHDSILHDMFVYGYAYVERVFDVFQKKILDLKMIDAKLIDYARDGQGNIILDESQRPIGFVMEVGRLPDYMGDKYPAGVVINSNQIYLEAKRIALFKCFSFGNRFESLGFIETSYVDIKRKHLIEDSVTNSIYNNIHKHIIGYVGNDSIRTGETQRKSVLDALKNLSYNRYAVFSMPTKIETLDAQISDQTSVVLDYLRINQSAASGMPVGMSLGAGEAINRSVLNVQQKLLFLTANSIANSYALQFKREILDWIYKYNKFDEKAKLEFEEINVEDKNAKTERLIKDVEKKIICPEEAREYVLISEHLIPNEKKYKEYLNTTKEIKKEVPFEEEEEEDSLKDNKKI